MECFDFSVVRKRLGWQSSWEKKSVSARSDERTLDLDFLFVRDMTLKKAT